MKLFFSKEVNTTNDDFTPEIFAQSQLGSRFCRVETGNNRSTKLDERVRAATGLCGPSVYTSAISCSGYSAGAKWNSAEPLH